MEVVGIVRVTRRGGTWVEVDVGVLNLAAVILGKLPKGSREKHREEVEKVKRFTVVLGDMVEMKEGRGQVEGKEEVVYMLAEIMEELGLV